MDLNLPLDSWIFFILMDDLSNKILNRLLIIFIFFLMDLLSVLFIQVSLRI